ncbi:MAG: hypothetical protein COA79_05015 [Planctomycetota bacterium]|nr:MAG: hypothetical protein COA79_05015 [Planctomycetota bacterium]
MVETFFYIFIFAFALSLCLTSLALIVSPKIGFYDLPDERKSHSKPIPYGGGVAIFASMIISLGVFWLCLHFIPENKLPEHIQRHLSGLENSAVIKQLVGIFIGASIIFMIGLVDDVKNLGAKLKLILQFLAAGIVIYSGTKITAFISEPVFHWFLTAIWIVALTNAYNLLDNMDGLSSGVAIISALLLLVVTLQSGELFIAALILVFIGAMAGFWVFNYSPAKIFLGDSGSLLIGFFLAVLTILPTFYNLDGGKPSKLAILLPVFVQCIPIFDTISVMIIRWKRKKPFFIGDKNHFSHRLVDLGLTKHQAVLVIYLLCISIGISAIFMQTMTLFQGTVLAVQALMIFLIVVILENAGRNTKNKKDK